MSNYNPQEKYRKGNIRIVPFCAHKTNDAEIINFLRESGNASGTIREALKMYMATKKYMDAKIYTETRKETEWK